MPAHAPRPTARPAEPLAPLDEPVHEPVDALGDGLVVLSVDGRVLEANRAARQRFGVRRDGPLPGYLAGHVAALPDGAWPAQRAASTEPTGPSPATEPFRAPVDVLVTLDGRPAVLSVGLTPLDDGERWVLLLRDVTAEREQLDALSAFAGVVAHDVRGPIAAMVGWSETALDALLSRPDPDPVEVAALLSRLHHGAQRLDRMVGNLLLHATSRDRELELAPVDLVAVVDEVAEARDVRELVEVHALPKVSGDAPMLQHLMDNLLGNAVKFVAAGVRPRVVVAGAADGPDVRVTVSDNGIGIPAGMRQQVFQRFERVPGTGLGGTGMGLSICRTIVLRHGGDIAVSDGPDGVGTTFEVRLPAA